MVSSDPAKTGDNKIKFRVDLGSCQKDGEFEKSPGRIQLTVADYDQISYGSEFFYGDIIRFQAQIKSPSDFKNPGGFKYRRHLLSKGISATAFISDPRWITKIGITSGHIIRLSIEDLRMSIGDSLEAIGDEKIRALARALTIGNGSYVSEDVKEDFRRSGLAHILVISGLNVGFVAVFVFFLARWILVLIPGLAQRINIFKPSAAATIVIVWVYTYLTGADVSVMRAAIMATVYLAGIVIDKRQDLFTTLALAALIIIADSPLAIYDISFQLSFVAVISIAAIYPRLVAAYRWMQPSESETVLIKIRRYALQTAAISVAASIGVSPLLAYYFHYSSFVGVFANILVVPWAGFIVTPISLIVAPLAAISASLAHWPVVILGYSIWPIRTAAHITAAVADYFTIVITPPVLAIFAFYGLVGLFLLRKKFRYFLPAAGACIITIFTSLGLQHGWFERPNFKVTFLDVGQGSSIVVRFPNKNVMVVDGGGFKDSSFDIGKFVVAPYLWHEGISRVDRLVLTHAHPDHFGGLAYLAEEFAPRQFLWNGVVPDEEEREAWDEFNLRLKKTGVPMRTVAAPSLLDPRSLLQPRRDKLRGDDSESGNVLVEILSPPVNIPQDWNVNNTSVVMRISYGDASFLLTGDIESEAEAYLISTGQLSNLSTYQRVILQVPHHGSATSSSYDFISAVKPTDAVIQAGRNNRYGFPKKDVLERLNEAGARIHRTDLEGAVTFKIYKMSHF